MGRERYRVLIDSLESSTSYQTFKHVINGVNVYQWFPNSSGQHGTYSGEGTTDVVTSNYFSRIAAGEIINNPYERRVHTETYAQPGLFSFRITHPTTGEYWDCTGPRQTDHDVWDLADAMSTFPGMSEARSSAIEAAVTAAHANVDVSSMLALTTVAESRQTISSVVSILRRVLNIYRALKRVDLRYLRRQISRRELEDRYMELRYAIRPLLYDISGIADGATRARGRTRRTFRGSGSGSFSGSSDRGTVYPIDVMRCKKTSHASYSVSARAGVLCDCTVSELNVWGIDQLPETAWELLPFSFILDRFIKVGELIAAWTPNAGVNQRASWVTVKETFSTSTVYDQPWVVHAWDKTCSMATQTHTRTENVLTRMVEPPVTIYPRVDMRLDGYFIADLIIILKRML